MHELLVLDDQFASPSTYACFAPWHFLLTEKWMIKFGRHLLPDKRPMDNMRAGWALPQEDEFALMNLGAPTPYLRIMFPQREPPWMNFLDMRGIDDQDLAAWKGKLTWFIKALTLQHRRQLVLKSPPHTGRVAELLKIYPNAKFVHLVRDPRKLFASTIRLWQSLASVQGMQSENDQSRLESYVWECFHRMYTAFEADRIKIPAGRIIDVRYEDLVADPVATMSSVYASLELNGFEEIRPMIAARFAAERNYQANEHHIDPELEKTILSNWSDYAHRYGYA
jgi:hypothetical protein